MANTVARAWDHERLNDLIPPLTLKSSAEAWEGALRDRVNFAMLLKEHPNLFAPASDAPVRQLLATGANEILAQAATHDAQKKTGDGRPRSRRRPPILKSLIGDPDPFGATTRALVNVVQNTQVGPRLRAYVQGTSKRMILGCIEDAKASDRVVYLVAQRWDACNPLQKVQGVLASKVYNNWIRAEAAERAAEQRRLAAAQAPPANAIGHSHLPSLTSRQARRSGLSEEQLIGRWT